MLVLRRMLPLQGTDQPDRRLVWNDVLASKNPQIAR